MIPIVKGWSTEMAQHVASLGIQVHGGMGYIEETGAAQYLRDARITTIYEGTTGIQANDLIGRKIARDGGKALAAHVVDDARNAARARGGRARRAAPPSAPASARASTRWKRPRHYRREPVPDRCALPCWPARGRSSNSPASSAAARSSGARALAAARKLGAGEGDAVFLRAKIATARHFADHCLTHAPGLCRHGRERGGQACSRVADEAL